MKVPEWVVGYDEDDEEFLVHLAPPIFVMQFNDEGFGTPTFLDSSDEQFMESCLADGKEPILEMARLMREAGAFYASMNL